MALTAMAVCTGNICRSPTMHVVLRDKLAAAGFAELLEVESSGTHGHVGWPADDRSVAAAAKRGYDLNAHRGRRLSPEDYSRAAVLLAADAGHARLMASEAPLSERRKVVLYMRYAALAKASPGAGAAAGGLEIEDPYYEDGTAAFDEVVRQCELGADGFVEALRLATGHPELKARPLGEVLLDFDALAAAQAAARKGKAAGPGLA